MTEKRREYLRRWYAARPGYSTERSRLWRESHPGYTAKRSKLYRLRHPGEHYKYAQKWIANHPEARRAHQAIRRALKAGKIKREHCWQCSNPDTHAHHPDYNKPMEIVWLCDQHHKQEHIKIRKEIRLCQDKSTT